MEDLTQRLINALRKAVTNARNADDAAEAAYLADALDVEGAPVVPATAAIRADDTPGEITITGPVTGAPPAIDVVRTHLDGETTVTTYPAAPPEKAPKKSKGA